MKEKIEIKKYTDNQGNADTYVIWKCSVCGVRGFNLAVKGTEEIPEDRKICCKPV